MNPPLATLRHIEKKVFILVCPADFHALPTALVPVTREMLRSLCENLASD